MYSRLSSGVFTRRLGETPNGNLHRKSGTSAAERGRTGLGHSCLLVLRVQHSVQ
jgi:hypothetical protein